MKVIELPRQATTDLTAAEALIAEARHRQRRRWLFVTGIIVVIATIMSGLSYTLVSRRGTPARTGASSPPSTRPAAKSHTLMAYVLNSASGIVTPINTLTNRAGKPIKVGKQAQYIGVSLDGKTVYVGSGDLSTDANANVIPIPVGTNRADKPVKLSVVKMGAWCATNVATTRNGKTDYLVVPSEGIVLPINVATGVAGKPIRVAPGPSAIVLT